MPHIIGLIVAVFLSILAANGVRAEEKGACRQDDKAPPQEASPREIELRGYGPALNKENVREALMQAVDWAYLTESLFDDPYLLVFFFPPPPDQQIQDTDDETQDQIEEVLDNYSLEFDYGGALSQLSMTDFNLALIYCYEPDVAELADGIAYDLGQLNIEVAIYEAESSEELVNTAEILEQSNTGIDAIVLTLVR